MDNFHAAIAVLASLVLKLMAVEHDNSIAQNSAPVTTGMQSGDNREQ